MSLGVLKLWSNEGYPIMADLTDGWFLIAHPSGPAIARNVDYKFIGHLATSNKDDVVGLAIRSLAVDALMKWAVEQPTWPGRCQ